MFWNWRFSFILFSSFFTFSDRDQIVGLGSSPYARGLWEDAHKKVFFNWPDHQEGGGVGWGKTPWTTKGKKNFFLSVKKNGQNLIDH